jgi:Cu/Ag efflux pump CusA
VIPLVLSSGAGAEMRNAMGVAVFAGMIGVTVFGLVLTPVFYWITQRLVARVRARTLRTRLPTAAAPLLQH